LIRLVPASFKSAVYVVIQITCLFIIFYKINLIPSNIFILIGLAFFLILGIWAVYTMNFRFNIAPDISSNSKLIVKGPYKFIRHPMYTSVLGISFYLIMNDINYFRIIIFTILLVNFLFKLDYEEKILISKFPEYSEYKKTTKKLIPFLY